MIQPDLGAATAAPALTGVLVVDLPAASCTNTVIAKLRELLGAHPGATPVQVRFLSSHGVTPLDVGSYRVDPVPGLLSELRLLLGGDAARVEEPRAGHAERGVIRVPDASGAPAGARPPAGSGV